MSLEIIQKLERIHSRGQVHNAISSQTVRVDASMHNRVVCLQSVSNDTKTSSDLCFCSPEQTGRMNCKVVDCRSDLYAVGVVFFHMLCNDLPFHKTATTGRLLDPLELVHAHIAQTPPRVTDINPDVPNVLANIVAKLLEKDANDRYQSALSLGRDLQQAYDFYQASPSKMIPDFPLAQHDYSSQLSLPTKLYGRDEQVESRIRSNGSGTCYKSER